MKINPYMPIFVMGAIGLFSILFVAQGIGMHNKVVVEEQKFHDLQEEYFTLAKSDRDNAETGSELNAKLVQLEQYPSTLLELKLVGVGKILTGIYALLFGILIALTIMPFRLGDIINKYK